MVGLWNLAFNLARIAGVFLALFVGFAYGYADSIEWQVVLAVILISWGLSRAANNQSFTWFLLGAYFVCVVPVNNIELSWYAFPGVGVVVTILDYSIIGFGIEWFSMLAHSAGLFFLGTSILMLTTLHLFDRRVKTSYLKDG